MLEHLSCDQVDRAGTAKPGEEMAQGGLINVYKYMKGR